MNQKRSEESWEDERGACPSGLEYNTAPLNPLWSRRVTHTQELVTSMTL